MHRFDLFVICTGPAGQRAAVQAAKLGKSVGCFAECHKLAAHDGYNKVDPPQ